MTTSTILLLLLSLAIAGGLSFFQYFYKNSNRTKAQKILALLRFISIFGILLLLINPLLKRNTLEIVKTPLPIVIDNSSSIIDLKANQVAKDIFTKLIENSELQEKFEVQSYKFDSQFETIDSEKEIDFKGKQTNIEEVAKNLNSIHKNKTYPTILISDGNQTSGNDFVFSFGNTNKVYPVILGDTTTLLDIKVSQINANKYAFHKNKFPVEVFLNYSGTKSITANFSISQGNNILNNQTVNFSPSKKSAIVNVLIPADKVGLQLFKATLKTIQPEKNTYNNSKNFAVEIIDQKSEIAIVSAINHPDIGALKRSIETNIQRKVTIVKPREINDLQKYNTLILYQPTAEFKAVFDAAKNASINTFIITGINTDFNFLNQNQSNFDFKMSNQKEDYLASFDAQFNLFSIDNIGFEEFSPLQNSFGTITPKGNTSVLLQSRIRNIETKQPLLAFSEEQGKRAAFLFGENTWKWRMQTNIDNKSFEKYDVFIDKIIQFLISNNSKKSLVVNHERFYNSGEPLEITAQYFNKNYEFDEKARLSATITNKNTKQTKKYDLLKTTNAFKVNLDGLEPGQYNFNIKELNSNSTYNGYFEIIDFDIEKQFVNPDMDKLKQLATETNSKTIMPNQLDLLIKSLLNDDNYKAVQKDVVTKTPIIDWYWLLILIAISLASEWFIRKYNGML
jgi:lipid-A-disaccharide synthase-like uncharacterized protein